MLLRPEKKIVYKVNPYTVCFRESKKCPHKKLSTKGTIGENVVNIRIVSYFQEKKMPLQIKDRKIPICLKREF